MKITLLLLLLSASVCHGQSNDDKSKVTYKQGKAFFKMYDRKTEKQLNVVPFGTDVLVFYNNFFKSYNVYYKDERGVVNKIPYKFVYDYKNGSIKVTDHQSSDYTLTDTIEKDGRLFLIPDKVVNGVIACIVIEELSRE